MILKTGLVVAALTAAGTPAAMMLHERSDPSKSVVAQQVTDSRPVIRGPNGRPVNIRTCPQAYGTAAGATSWGIDCKVHAEVASGAHATMVCWVKTQAPEDEISTKWFQVKDVDGVQNVEPPVHLWVWSDYIDKDTQTYGTPECSSVGRENEPDPEPEQAPTPAIEVTGSCTSSGGTLYARTVNYVAEPDDLAVIHIGIWGDSARLREIARDTIQVHADRNVSWNWSCAGLAQGRYSTGIQLGMNEMTWGDFYVAEAPRQEAPKPEAPTQPQPDPMRPQPEPRPSEPDAPRPKPSEPTQPKPRAKPRISNFQVVVYDKEPGRVGVAYNVAWDEGRDPVTCRFFIDNVERFTAQCGTYSSKQFYNLPEGNHTFYATVSDRHGVYSDPSPKVTKYVPGKPAERSLTIYNKVTNGSSEMREDTPAYLSTVTRNYCRRDGCAISNTDMNTGATITGLCWLWGDRTTNGEDGNSRDDGNPGLYTSTRWYKARHPDGAVGYISEVWIDPAHRGGAGLPAC